MRKIGGLLSEERKEELTRVENMTFEELDEYIIEHNNELNENVSQPIYVDMPYEDFLKKYKLVDVTSFFVNHGLKIEDLDENNNNY